jgi:hypothetical protein
MPDIQAGSVYRLNPVVFYAFNDEAPERPGQAVLVLGPVRDAALAL